MCLSRLVLFKTSSFYFLFFNKLAYIIVFFMFFYSSLNKFFS